MPSRRVRAVGVVRRDHRHLRQVVPRTLEASSVGPCATACPIKRYAPPRVCHVCGPHFACGRVANMLKPILLLLAWVLARYVDFASGFVGYSFLRLGLAALLLVMLFLPFPRGAHWWRAAAACLERRRTLSLALLCCLAAVGYTLFLSRYHRGAHMGDLAIFRQSIERTAAFEGLLPSSAEGGSHFRAHNSPVLLLLVPISLVAGAAGWYVIQFVHSLMIVFMCHLVGRAVLAATSRPHYAWGVTLALFLASFYQHATFYETRFAAAGVALLVLGLLQAGRRRELLAGFMLGLASRETTALSVAGLLLPGTQHIQPPLRRTLLAVALLWFVASYALIRQLGGPVSAGRFPAELAAPALSVHTAAAVPAALSVDWKLKAGYTARLLSFGPVAVAAPAVLCGLAPELAFAWLSKDNVLYSLSWHYYLPLLAIIVPFAFAWVSSLAGQRWLTRWVVATCLWQFVTTVHPRLF